jgi:hypothetical protein
LTDIELAAEALSEVLEEGSFGELISTEDIPKGVELKFSCLMPGYTDWHWQVTLSKVTAKSTPTVSEINLLAGDDSLVSPPWVPWAERLAEYRKARREQRESLQKSEEAEPDNDSWVDVDENKMDEPIEIDLPDLEPSDADVEESKDPKADTDDGGVKPPAKTSRAKRVKKTQDDNKDNDPNQGANK